MVNLYPMAFAFSYSGKYAITQMKEAESQNIGHSAMVDCQF